VLSDQFLGKILSCTKYSLFLSPSMIEPTPSLVMGLSWRSLGTFSLLLNNQPSIIIFSSNFSNGSTVYISEMQDKIDLKSYICLRLFKICVDELRYLFNNYMEIGFKFDLVWSGHDKIYLALCSSMKNICRSISN
jgi:hypothetical protein